MGSHIVFISIRQEGSRVRKGSRVQQEIPEEGWRAHWLKRCTDYNEDEDNSPNNTDNTNLSIYQSISTDTRSRFIRT